MFRQITISGVAAGKPRTYTLDPKGRTDIAGPSGSGKSTLVHALTVLLAGDAVNRTHRTEYGEPADAATVTGTTAKGTVLGVTTTTKGSTWSRDGAALATRADYMAALGKWGGDIPALIVAPMRWCDLAAGTAEPLAKVIARILPAGDVPARVKSLMGGNHRDGDPCDVPGALAAQKLANSAKDAAVERVTRARLAVAAAEKARADIVAPTAEELAEAEATLTADALWTAYDRDARAWTAYDAALSAWTAQAPGEAPAYDAEGHQAARMKVDALTAKLDKETRAAEAAAAAERAKAEAEAKAARDAEEAATRAAAETARQLVEAAKAAEVEKARAVAAAEAARPAAPPLFAPAPKSTPCPACAGTGRISA